jgi:deoxyxylulose-5-phosphate synthase
MPVSVKLVTVFNKPENRLIHEITDQCHPITLEQDLIAVTGRNGQTFETSRSKQGVRHYYSFKHVHY